MPRPAQLVGGRGTPASGAATAAAAVGINVFDPIEVARSDPYFKRNHMGRVTCSLCNIVCNDESAFTKHTAGKTHSLQLENIDRLRRKRQRLEEEMRIDEQKAAAAARERATRELLSSAGGKAAGSGGGIATIDGVAIVTGPFGLPTYHFRTEHVDETTRAEEAVDGDAKKDASSSAISANEDGAASTVLDNRGHQKQRESGDATETAVVTAAPPLHALHPASHRTKVWLDFHFSKAEEGVRPLHRWLSAREQHVETPADDYFVYLLIACEGYTTVALKFPAKLKRSQDGDACDENGESVYRCWWDPLRKEYALFFILSRE